MNSGVARERLPRVVASILFAVGGLAFLSSVAVFVVTPPPGIAASLPTGYKLALAGLAIAGGVAHVVAGIRARQRRPVFSIAAATLVGMVLLQVSAPLDVLVLALLAVGRDEFGESDR